MEFGKPTNSPIEQQGLDGASSHGTAGQENGASVRTLGRYQIQEELGRGAMGAVYKAYDPVIARTVALKTILIDSHAPDRAQMIERLKQEAKAAGGLDHPNIITIYDVGEENGAVYLSMQFVKGTTLAELLADSGVPSLPTLLSWADQISAAVGFAHERWVIHRDLKPANLMVTEQGAIKVLDFGIAKIENTSLTQTGLIIGTPSYMSPEQIAGKKVDHRADIFSLGAVFYELLTREKAFDGEVTTVLYKIVNEDPVAPSLVNPAIPGGIDAVIRKALAKDPKDRFQTCEEMRKAFREKSIGAPLTAAAGARAEKTVAIPAPAAASIRRAPQLVKSRSRVWPSLALAPALVVIVAASWAFYVRSRTGAFPSVVAKIASKSRQALSPATEKFDGSSTQALQRGIDEHGSPVTSPQSAMPSNAPAAPVDTTQTIAAQAGANQADSSPAVATASQPVTAQSSSDHLTSETAPAAGATTSSLPTQTLQKPADSSETVSRQAPEAGDMNRPAGANETAQDSSNASVASHEDDKQSAAVPVARPPARRRTQEQALTVDGFRRQDVPDLLRQAESSRARGKYRLARYEYGLVLKLDHNNVEAREALRNLPAVWQSR